MYKKVIVVLLCMYGMNACEVQDSEALAKALQENYISTTLASVASVTREREQRKQDAKTDSQPTTTETGTNPWAGWYTPKKVDSNPSAENKE